MDRLVEILWGISVLAAFAGGWYARGHVTEVASAAGRAVTIPSGDLDALHVHLGSIGDQVADVAAKVSAQAQGAVKDAAGKVA